jgi:hypothetical protein
MLPSNNPGHTGNSGHAVTCVTRDSLANLVVGVTGVTTVSRSAICPALWPLVQSAVSNAMSEAFHSMGVGLYTKHKGLQKGWRHRPF